VFEEVFGIPAHPLLVHAAVVFVPLQILAAFAYALLPFARHYIAWLVAGLAALAPATAWLAQESGEAFQERLVRNKTVGDELIKQINEHSSYADKLLLASIVLSLLMVSLVLVQMLRSRRPSDGTAGSDTDKSASGSGKGSIVVAAILTVAVLGVGAGTGYLAFKTGDTGAQMVWSNL
jgi:hypothetical protein